MDILLDLLAFPVMTVDAELRIRDMNSAARRYLAANGVMEGTKGGVLRLEPPMADRALREALAKVIAGESDRASVALDDGKGRPVVLSLAPMRADLGAKGQRAAIFVSGVGEVGPDIAAVARHYGLTETEAALAEAVAAGRTVAEFADRRGMAVSTARWHLKNLETKLGVSRIEELVAVIHRTVTPIGGQA
ncbi:MAG: hypothetical protein D6688_13365 [Alphaproteobacteria bacterium]|nr:MAG: hypothetical protein D6688_13365 [Alphaproteobacteria bacterium]